MSVKTSKNQSQILSTLENEQNIDSKNNLDIIELQKELKSKNKKIYELKNKNHEQKILLKFFLNNADNLDDLLEIQKQVKIRDDQIEKINKELNDTKISNETFIENIKYEKKI